MSEASHEMEITIYVNTRPKEVTKNEDISFERAIDLAYDGNPPSGPNVEFTVMYQRAEGNKDGTLVPGGQPVKAKEGMIFDVTATDRS
jgi:hypothetical protein